jgi:threonine synthase
MYFKGYRCTLCRKEYERDEVQYLCPACGKDYKAGYPLSGVLEVIYDYRKIAEEWKKKPCLDLFSPVERRYYPEIPVGNTPFYRSERLSGYLQGSDIWLKNDSLNPSGSLKDRASHLMVAEALRSGFDTIVTASTGNAASALAAMSAAQGLKAVIFVPASAPSAKISQIRIHNAELIEVAGDYDDAFARSLEYTKNHEGLNRNTAYHPFTVEGKKSAGLEIFLQNRMRIPDWIVIPVGDGVIFTGIFKAFKDLYRAELIDRIPKLLAVQAESSAAIIDYYRNGKYRNAPAPKTIADSISVKAPSNAYWACECLKQSKGGGVKVSDQEIREGQRALARLTGVFAEPAAAAVMAGVEKSIAGGLIKTTDQTVLLITGHGLKDIRSLER